MFLNIFTKPKKNSPEKICVAQRFGENMPNIIEKYEDFNEYLQAVETLRKSLGVSRDYLNSFVMDCFNQHRTELMRNRMQAIKKIRAKLKPKTGKRTFHSAVRQRSMRAG